MASARIKRKAEETADDPVVAKKQAVETASDVPCYGCGQRVARGSQTKTSSQWNAYARDRFEADDPILCYRCWDATTKRCRVCRTNWVVCDDDKEDAHCDDCLAAARPLDSPPCVNWKICFMCLKKTLIWKEEPSPYCSYMRRYCLPCYSVKKVNDRIDQLPRPAYVGIQAWRDFIKKYNDDLREYFAAPLESKEYASSSSSSQQPLVPCPRCNKMTDSRCAFVHKCAPVKDEPRTEPASE